MKEGAIYVGIDVAKANIGIAVRPTGMVWQVSHDVSGIGDLVSQLENLKPATVLLEATCGLEIPPGGSTRCGGIARCGGQSPTGARFRQSHRPPC